MPGHELSAAGRPRLWSGARGRVLLLTGIAATFVGVAATAGDLHALILRGVGGWDRDEVVLAPPPRLSFGYVQPPRALTPAEYATALAVADTPAVLNEGFRFKEPATGLKLDSEPRQIAAVASLSSWPVLTRPPATGSPPEVSTNVARIPVIPEPAPSPRPPARVEAAEAPTASLPRPPARPPTANLAPVEPTVRRELAAIPRPPAPAPAPREVVAPPRPSVAAPTAPIPRPMIAPAAVAPYRSPPAPVPEAVPMRTQYAPPPSGDTLARARLRALPPPPAIRMEAGRGIGRDYDND
jgi:hypothetical protein